MEATPTRAPADMEEQGKVSPEPSSSSVRLKQGEMEQEAKPWRRRRLQEWGLSWMRKNLLLLMTHGQTLTPPLVAAPLCVQPRRSQGHHERLLLRCMLGSQRWRNSELAGYEGHPVLISVNL